MLTIILTPQMEKRLTRRAQQQGTTPEMLALDSLNAFFPPSTSEETAIEGTLADFLGGFIGSIHSSGNVPGGAQMSMNSSKKFAEGMLKKR